MNFRERLVHIAAVLLLFPAFGQATRPSRDVLLLSGFGPFGKVEINPSWEAIKDLDGTTIQSFRVRVVRLPVEYDRAGDVLLAAAKALSPRVVLALGAAPHEFLHLETWARNLDDSDLLDTAGTLRRSRTIVPGAPKAYRSTLPLIPLIAALKRRGVGTKISFSAGGYLCNHVFYRLMHWARGRRVRAGFVHVPMLGRRKKDGPRITRAQVTRAVRTLVRAVACLPFPMRTSLSNARNRPLTTATPRRVKGRRSQAPRPGPSASLVLWSYPNRSFPMDPGCFLIFRVPWQINTNGLDCHEPCHPNVALVKYPGPGLRQRHRLPDDGQSTRDETDSRRHRDGHPRLHPG